MCVHLCVSTRNLSFFSLLLISSLSSSDRKYVYNTYSRSKVQIFYKVSITISRKHNYSDFHNWHNRFKRTWKHSIVSPESILHSHPLSMPLSHSWGGRKPFQWKRKGLRIQPNLKKMCQRRYDWMSLAVDSAEPTGKMNVISGAAGYSGL